MFDIVIFDWKRTLYNSDEKTLISGARKLLEFIKSKNIPVILIGKGGKDMNDEVSRLGVESFFSHVVFAQGEKDPKVFGQYISKSNPQSTILIGDRVRSELEIGKKLGATTIWVKQGKFASEKPETNEQKPDYTVLNLVDCLNLLLSLN